MFPIPSLGELRAAAERISGKALRTPLVYSEPLSELTGHDVYVKPEGLQTGGAFKYRGATNAISQLSEEQRKEGVITASSGNHGIAVALAAEKAGVKATVIVPNNAPDLKVKMIEDAGANIIRYGENYNDCEDRAREITSEAGHFIHPFEDPRVIAGQGTIGLELAEDAPSDLHAVLVPVGGGGVISGIALGLGYTRSGVDIIGVEPENCASFHAAHSAEEPVWIDVGSTCAGGLHTRRIGNAAYEILKNGPAPVMVSEEEILEATRFCIERLKFVVEPSGAAGVAALLSGRYEPVGTTIVILSGSNLDRKWLEAALEMPPRS